LFSKTHLSKFVKKKSSLLVAVALSLAAQDAYAALAITNIGLSGTFTAGNPETITGSATLTSVTTTEGTFTNLVGAVSSNAAGERIYKGTDPGADNSTVLGLTASDGLLNLTSAPTSFQFGTTFSASTRFFILDVTSVGGGFGDPATISLIDSAGAVVGTYSYGLTAAAFGTNVATITSATREGTGTITLETSGVSFSLADFIGTGDFSTATGIRLASASSLDPTVVGIYTVPEPTSMGLAIFAGAAFAWRRRRSA